MRSLFITETAEADIVGIYEYLLEHTPNSAAQYYQQALSTFRDFPYDIWQPTPAGLGLPDHVYVLHLSSPYRAYTLWVSITDEAAYLLAAFAPGLSDRAKKRRIRHHFEAMSPWAALKIAGRNDTWAKLAHQAHERFQRE